MAKLAAPVADEPSTIVPAETVESHVEQVAVVVEPEKVEPIAELTEKSGTESYLDIPAFLRRQADN